MSDIVNFKCLRIRSEMSDYIKKGIWPQGLRDASYTINDVESCLGELPFWQKNYVRDFIPKYQKIAQSEKFIQQATIKKEYRALLSNLKTTSTEFKFPTILSDYRSDINPVSAIYYNTLEVVRAFNTHNEKHHWIINIVKDRKFNTKLITALTQDINQLKTFLEEHNHIDITTSLELFHAWKMSEDFNTYKNFFTDLQNWQADE